MKAAKRAKLERSGWRVGDAAEFLELSPDETLLLGGLMSNEHNRVWDGIPFIADIPILGELVRSRRFQCRITSLIRPVTRKR